MVETPVLSFNPELVNSEQMQWHVLTGPQFEDALSGKLDANYEATQRAWLQNPKLRYYHPAKGLRLGKDTRVFFMATLPCEPDEYSPSAHRKAIALLEIDFEYQSTDTVGIKYVSVHEACRQFGLAKKAYELLVKHLKAHSLRLYRTKPGRDTPTAFSGSITRLLDKEGIDWFYR